MAANTHMSTAIVADQTMAATDVGPNGVQMRQIATLTLSPRQTREAHTPYPQQMESPRIIQHDSPSFIPEKFWLLCK